MVWQKIDDQFGVSKKVIRIPKSKRHQCVGLWTLAGNFSVRTSSNGILEAHELDELDARKADVAELVRVDLWHAHGHQCASCDPVPTGAIVIHDFLEYNPDAASVAASKESKAEGGRHGNHLRWHKQRALLVAGCEWCASDNRSDNRMATDSLANPPGPVPSPYPKTDISETHKSLTESDAEFVRTESERVGIKNLARITATLKRVVTEPINEFQAIDIARDLSGLSMRHVDNLEAYIDKIAVNSPGEIRDAWEAHK